MSFRSASVLRNVDLVAIGVPVLAVEVDARLAVLCGSFVGEFGLQMRSLGVKLDRGERALSEGKVGAREGFHLIVL